MTAFLPFREIAGVIYMKQYYLYTFRTNDLSLVFDYFPIQTILFCCKHFGKDTNGLDINTHFHFISEINFIQKYDKVFEFKKNFDILDFEKFYNYCVNGHCSYEIVVFNDDVYSIVKTLLQRTKRISIDDLINELVYNIDNDIHKSHSYYLKRYGYVYLKHFKDIRLMFDSGSYFKDIGKSFDIEI